MNKIKDKNNIGDKVINNYEIKKTSNEEILYLYFDFNYELGKIEKLNKTNIEKQIKKYISDKKIIFKGTTIILLSGTIIFGKINIPQKSNLENITISEKLITKIDNKEPSILKPLDEKPLLKQEVTKKTEINNQQKTKESKETIEKSKENIGQPKIEKEESNIKATIEKPKENIEQTKIEKEESNIKATIEKPKENIEQTKIEKEETIIDTNKYVNIKRKTGETIKIELEEYIIGVVGAEMPASFHSEALKAQAIISRTYALKSIESGKILSDNESTQSYKTNEELKKTWQNDYDKYYNKIKQAVEETKGMYISYNNHYIEAVYHSTSNGQTEDAINVWKTSYPYLISVESPYDKNNPSYIKDISLTYQEISKKLGFTIDKDTEIDILEKTSSNRIKTIKIGQYNLDGVELRNKLGLRSTDITIKKTENEIIFETIGYGHGVGMSQYGANGYANQGYNYQNILNHYYPGTKINKQ